MYVNNAGKCIAVAKTKICKAKFKVNDVLGNYQQVV